MESIERRALLLAIGIAIFLDVDRLGAFTTTTGRGWEVFIYIVGLVSAGAAGVSLVAAVAPTGVAPLRGETRERLLFAALALLVLAILTVVLLRSHSTYYLHRHGLPI